MLIEYDTTYKALCDVCGTSERFGAASHAEAWDKLKRAAWAVRCNAFPIIHICPECPIQAPKR